MPPGEFDGFPGRGRERYFASCHSHSRCYFATMEDADYFLPAAAALHAGVSEVLIHQAIERGELRTVMFKGHLRIPAESLWEYQARSVESAQRLESGE